MQKKIIKTVVVFILIAAVIFAGYKWWSGRNALKKSLAQTSPTAKVTRGDLEVVLNGSGTLEPMDQDTINLKVEGTVKKVYVKEGSVVKKGDLLYELEDPTLDISLQKAQLSIAEQKLNLNDALEQKGKSIVYAPEDGVVKTVDVDPGDPVSDSTVLATTLNENKTQVKVPFNSAQLKNIKLGQNAEVLLLDTLYTVKGKVTKIDTVATPMASGARYYYVTIEINGNYYVENEDTAAQVYIVTNNGKEEGLEQVSIEPLDTVEIKPEISSTIKQVYVDEGDKVKKGQKLFSLDEEDIETNIEKQQLSLQQAELDLESKLKEKEDLFVYAPIDGTVIEQNVREGDLIKPSTSNSSSDESAATIVDYSKMQVVLPIDELDISKVKVGMPVKITAEALAGETFEGTVEEIADEGVSQNNVSTFNVTVTMDKTSSLKAGMTVDAELTVDKKQDVLMLPLSAIQQKDGKSYVVLANGKASGAKTQANANKDNNSGSNGNNSDTTGKFNGSNNNRNSGNNSNINANNSSNKYNKNNNSSNTAGSMQMVEVQTGISNDDYIEIVSGLNEGDVVLTSESSSSSSNRMGGMMFGPGGGGGEPPRR